MLFSPLYFGKHKGLSLSQVMFKEPSYLFWGIGAPGVFKDRFRFEALAMYQRSTSIRIPPEWGTNAEVEYAIGYSGRFEGMAIVDAGVLPDGGGTQSYTLDVIDMSASFRACPRDRGGNEILLRNLREILFGPGVRITKRRAEDFFSDDSNFRMV